MNKTITVNISGLVFYIEEPGFELLKAYLDKLKSIFRNTAGGDDIIDDIESRIAELFKARLGDTKEVIHEADVREVLDTLGRPEDYADQAEEQETYTHASNSGAKQPKRMFRDTENEYVAGVAAGLAHYFGWDVVVIRLIFVLLAVFGGSGIPIYFILWMVVPAAKTTADKLNMRGEPVTLDNIKRKVEEELKTAEGRIKSGAKRAENAFRSSQFKSGIENAGSAFGKIIQAIVGIWLLLMGIGIVIGPLIGYFIGDVFMGADHSPLSMADLVFPDSTSMWMVLLGAVLIWLIPAVVLMYLGIRLLGVQSKPHPSVGWLMTGLFIAGIVTASIGGARTGKAFSRSGQTETKLTIEQSVTDTLHVRVLDDSVFRYPSGNFHDVEFFDLYKNENDSIYVAEPLRLYFEELPSGSKPSLTVTGHAQGESYEDAQSHAENIAYNFGFDSTGIWLGSHIRFPVADKIRGQFVEINIGLPAGKVICFDQNIRRLYQRNSIDEGCFTRQNKEWSEAR